MNVFIHTRDLRIQDNTTLIKQCALGSILPIFVFVPQQIDKKINKYFSNNLVQFMIASLEELDKDYKKRGGKLHYFEGEYIDVLDHIDKKKGIASVGLNVDYSPYAKKRADAISRWCDKRGIPFYYKEDMLLHPIFDGRSLNGKGECYKVFTPFKRNAIKKLKVQSVDNSSNKCRFIKVNGLDDNVDIHKFYKFNEDISVPGGRSYGLLHLKQVKTDQKKYDKLRNCFTYRTTYLSAYVNMGVISIREVYEVVKKVNDGIVNELYWRDFYYNILNFYPDVIGNSFNPKFDKIKWRKSRSDFEKWANGRTGYPIVDAGMRELNEIGYMHNRCRMIVASFLTKNLLIDWRWGERYFANKLTDYNISSNNGGWSSITGNAPHSLEYWRIFNPWTQAKTYDPNCNYIKQWVVELRDVPCEDIHKWDIACDKYDNIDYPPPMVDYKESRERALLEYKKAVK